MNKIKPPPLRPGDTVGIVSPSWGGAGAFPHRTAQGIKHLHSLGYTVKIGRHALNQLGPVSDTTENRAGDIHDMFADPAVRVVLAAIGGDHAADLLPLLDFELIAHNPKIFMGYSDITVLNVAIWEKTGLITFNGPALLTDFGEYPRMFAYTESNMLKVLAEPRPAGPIEPSPWWTEEFQDWEEKQDQRRPREQLPSTGWNWLKGGEGEGILIGGALESLEYLRQGPFWPSWENAIFFLETTEEKPTPEDVGQILEAYKQMGAFDNLKGMLVGRPYGYTLEEVKALDQILLTQTTNFRFPIVTQMDFGHTAPQLTLPIGCLARIDSQTRLFEILEAAVSEGA